MNAQSTGEASQPTTGRAAGAGLAIGHVNLARGFRGGERQTELLIRELAALGFRQRLVGRPDSALCARLRDVDGLTLEERGSVLSAARALRGVDLVHVHDGRAVQAGALASLLYSTPYIVTRRVDNPIKGNAITHWMYRRAARVVVLSHGIEAIVAQFDPELAIDIVPSACSTDQPDPAKVAELRASFGGGPVAGHVGALDDSHKGQLALIAAARRLPEVTFVLVGSGVDEGRLKAAAAGLENVIFTGQVADVASHLAAFDLFVFPSRHEGLGSILLDAMRLNLPVVATAVGGIPDIVHDGDNGILVELDDIDALVAAIRELADDEDERARIGLNAHAAVQAYSARQMAQRYASLYARVMADHAD